MPSMSGMLISIRTTFGLVSLASWMPSRPLRAMPTTSMSGSNCNSLRMFSRVSAKSSTIKTRIFAPALLAIYLSNLSPRVSGADPVVQLGRQGDIEFLEHILQGYTFCVDPRRIAGRAQGQGYHH